MHRNKVPHQMRPCRQLPDDAQRSFEVEREKSVMESCEFDIPVLCNDDVVKRAIPLAESCKTYPNNHTAMMPQQVQRRLCREMLRAVMYEGGVQPVADVRESELTLPTDHLCAGPHLAFFFPSFALWLDPSSYTHLHSHGGRKVNIDCKARYGDLSCIHQTV